MTIFDDISQEETAEYDYYKELYDIDPSLFDPTLLFPSDEEFGFDIKKASKGFILSYGNSKGLVPAGVFILIGYCDQMERPVDEEFVRNNGGTVVFKQIEINEREEPIIKENGSRIIMPYIAYQIASQYVDHNNEVLDSVSSNEWMTFSDINLISDTIGDIIAESNPTDDVKDIYLRGSSLENSRSSHTLLNGKEMGTNYSFYPFELAPKRIMVAFEPRIPEDQKLVR